ncbi:MAG: hypothetical protein AAF488_11910 [Planctomycetota bacterium]
MGQKQRQMSERQKREQQKREEQMAQKEPKDKPGPTRHDQQSDGKNPEVEVGSLEAKKGQGRWGRLPRTDVESMYESGKRKLPEKYRILLEEYFRRLPTSSK